MTWEKKISVIIPNYNYARYLDQAIESVLNQTYKNLELIVVNNGSTDDSLEILNKYKHKILVVNQTNLGQSGARNSGLLHATGEYIAFLDADDFWELSKLARQIPLVNESTQLIYCGIAPFKDPGPEVMPILLPSHKGECMRFFTECPGSSVVLSGESTALFSRELLETVGTFDTELNSTAGWDFFRRCSRITRFNFVNEALVNYRLHSANMSNSKESVILDMRRAYSKMFLDSGWEMPKKRENQIRKSLEWSYLKTYLRNYELKMAILAAFNLFRLLSKSV